MKAERLHAELQQARREIATLREFVDHAASYQAHSLQGRAILVRPLGGMPVSPFSAVETISSRARQLQLQRV